MSINRTPLPLPLAIFHSPPQKFPAATSNLSSSHAQQPARRELPCPWRLLPFLEQAPACAGAATSMVGLSPLLSLALQGWRAAVRSLQASRTSSRARSLSFSWACPLLHGQQEASAPLQLLLPWRSTPLQQGTLFFSLAALLSDPWRPENSSRLPLLLPPASSSSTSLSHGISPCE
jgi:hypothetical protein